MSKLRKIALVVCTEVARNLVRRVTDGLPWSSSAIALRIVPREIASTVGDEEVATLALNPETTAKADEDCYWADIERASSVVQRREWLRNRWVEGLPEKVARASFVEMKW